MFHQKLKLIRKAAYYMNKLIFFLSAYYVYAFLPVKFVNSAEWSVPLAISTHTTEDKNPAISKLILDEIGESDLWIAWESNRDGNWNIYGSSYSPSSDKWSSPVQLTTHTSDDLAPVLVTNSLGVYLAWESNRDGNWNIYMKHFSDNEWSEPVQLTNNEADDRNSALSGLPGYIFLAWQSNRNENWDIFINWLTVSEWDSVRQVTFSPSDDMSPTIADGGYYKMLIAFESDRDSFWNIYSREYNFSSDVWGDILAVSESNSSHRNPILLEEGFCSEQFVCWQSDYDSESKIFSASYGFSGWENDKTIINDSSQNFNPQITSPELPLPIIGVPPLIVWCSDKDGNVNIYSEDGAITTHDSTDSNPAITSFCTKGLSPFPLIYWLTWQSNRDGDYNIYVTMNKKILTTVEEYDYSPDKRNYLLSQNYPNPFNSSTLIHYYIPENTFVNLSIYNIKGCKINTLVNDFRESGSFHVIWEGVDNWGNQVSSGIYIYSLTIGNRTNTRKLIMLR